MMINRRLAAGLLAAAAVGMLPAVAVAVPAAQAAPAAAVAPAAMRMMHLEARLRGGYPHAAGHADYQAGHGYRHLDVQVWNIRRLAGTRLVVYVHGARAGTMTVSRSGYAHLDLGRGVPACQPGQPVRVRTAKGALIASGTFHRMR